MERAYQRGEPLGDGWDVIELVCCNRNHKAKDLFLIGLVDVGAVELEEDVRREEADALVAVAEGVIAHQRVHQGGGLVDKGLIRLGAEDRPRPGRSGGDEADVANEALAFVGADLLPPQRDDLVGSEVLDAHASASRSSTARCRAAVLAPRARTWLSSRRSRYSWRAAIVMACLDVCCSAASASSHSSRPAMESVRSVNAIPTMIPVTVSQGRVP
jgi:hypothetical protein